MRWRHFLNRLLAIALGAQVVLFALYGPWPGPPSIFDRTGVPGEVTDFVPIWPFLSGPHQPRPLAPPPAEKPPVKDVPI